MAGGARSSPWARAPVSARAILSGLTIGLVGANVWPLLILALPAPIAAALEAVFLALYIAWAGGAFPPAATKDARRAAFRGGPLTPAQWVWGLTAAVAFAVSAHAGLVVLFRLIPFPAAAFHHGYDFSFIPGAPLRWLACIVSAASAGICEETGFRGYLQQPIERRHGAPAAIAVSTLLFAAVHLNKDWLVLGVGPVVVGAGVLLGLIAWASRSLVFAIVGHTLMDIGLFAYWWTQIAGVFAGRPIAETGADGPFWIAAAVLAGALALTLTAVWRLRGLWAPASARA